MSRDLTPTYLSALHAEVLPVAMFFEGEFDSGTVWVWSGPKDIEWNGQTWKAMPGVFQVSPITEDTSLEAHGMVVSLSGIDPFYVSIAISEARQGLRGKFWAALLTEDGEVVAEPELGFDGFLDVPVIQDGEDTCNLAISYEGEQINMQRALEWRYTDEAQRLIHSDDLGLQYITRIQDLDIQWGV